MKKIPIYIVVALMGLGLYTPTHAQAQVPHRTQACVQVTQNVPARAHRFACGPVTRATSVDRVTEALTAADAVTAADTVDAEQHVLDSYTRRSKAWWKALERQLYQAVAVPSEQISEVTLKNIIFFATHHSDKVNLDATVPRLVEIYRERHEVGYRMMAVVALHAIGEEGAMQQLNRMVATETPGMVRNVTIAALNDHYGRR